MDLTLKPSFFRNQMLLFVVTGEHNILIHVKNFRNTLKALKKNDFQKIAFEKSVRLKKSLKVYRS